MKIARLTRAFTNDDVTLGMLQFKGIAHDPIYTLENPWIDNKPYISCIPDDDYVVEKFNGAKFKDVFILQGVIGRSHILIHHGNTEEDTSGCILVGLSAGELHGEPAVLQSRDAMEYLRSLVGRKSFILEIR